MKRITAIILLLVMSAFAFYSCKKNDDTQIRIGYMAGPTGIGMAKLINDHGGVDANGKYNFIKYANTVDANTDLMNGKLDMACLPTNEAAKFYNTVNPDMQVLAINCLNSLCLLTNDNAIVTSLNDLNGKTIYTCKNGTPKIIFTKLLEAYGVNATIVDTIGDGDNAITLNTPQDLAPIIVGNKADIILAPEPIVSTALSKPVAKHTVTLDLGTLWENKFGTPIAMGCIVARKDFIKEHPIAVDLFLEAYDYSIDYMTEDENLDTAAQYVIDAGILADIAIAKRAIINLDDAIEFEDGKEMKNILINFYKIFNVNVLGGKLPDDGFYY